MILSEKPSFRKMTVFLPALVLLFLVIVFSKPLPVHADPADTDPAVTIDEVSLSITIPAPQENLDPANGTPATVHILGYDPFWVSNACWFNGANQQSGGIGLAPEAFIAGECYFAEITLEPDDGYVFTSETTVSIMGASVDPELTYLNDDGTFHITTQNIVIPTGPVNRITANITTYESDGETPYTAEDPDGEIWYPDGGGVAILPGSQASAVDLSGPLYDYFYDEDGPDINAEAGETVHVIPVASSGFRLVSLSWRGGNEQPTDITDTQEFVMWERNEPVIIDAVFRRLGENDPRKIHLNYGAYDENGLLMSGAFGGTASLDKTEAMPGETVTVSTEPAEGFFLQGIEWGSGVTIGEDITDTGSFTMWDDPRDVVVDVCFQKLPAEDPLDLYDLDISVSGLKNVTYNGKAQTQNPTVKYGDTTLVNGTDYTLTYANNKNAGKATVYINGIGKYTGTISKIFTISPAKVKIPAGKTLTYTGKAQIGVVPAATYTVANGTGTNAKTYKATVALKDKKNYIWSNGTITNKTISWTIKPVSVAKVTFPAIASKLWTGKALKPAFTAKFNGLSVKSTNTAAFAVSYKNNLNVGKATITVKGKGNYTGTKTLYFKIIPRGTTISKVTTAKKGFLVTWRRQATKMSKSVITGYQLQYSTSAKFTSGVKTFTVKGYKNTSKAIGGLTGGKRYYLRIRTYKTVGGANYYSAWASAGSKIPRK